MSLSEFVRERVLNPVNDYVGVPLSVLAFSLAATAVPGRFQPQVLMLIRSYSGMSSKTPYQPTLDTLADAVAEGAKESAPPNRLPELIKQAAQEEVDRNVAADFSGVSGLLEVGAAFYALFFPELPGRLINAIIPPSDPPSLSVAIAYVFGLFAIAGDGALRASIGFDKPPRMPSCLLEGYVIIARETWRAGLGEACGSMVNRVERLVGLQARRS